MITLPLQRPDVLAHRVAGDLLVHAPGSDDLHALHGTAARLWDLCDGTTSEADAAHRLGCTAAEVGEALALLVELQLVDAPSGPDRRTVVGGALLGSALLTTLALPNAAMASSDAQVVGGGTPTQTATGTPSPTLRFERVTTTVPSGTTRELTLPAGAKDLEVVITGGDGARGAGADGGVGGLGVRLVLRASDAEVGTGRFEVVVGSGVLHGGAGAHGGGAGGAGSTALLGGVLAVAAGGGGGGAAGGGTALGVTTPGGAGGGALLPGGGTSGGPTGAGGGPGTAGTTGAPSRGADAMTGTALPTLAAAGGGGGGGGGASGGGAGSRGQVLGTGIAGGGGGGGGRCLVPAGAAVSSPGGGASATVSYLELRSA